MSHELNSEAQFDLHQESNFSKPSKILPIISKDQFDETIAIPKLKSDKEENVCRICMEYATLTCPLISPCRCTGSVKYIHEECLKTWLVSQDKDLAEGTCELCQTKFTMVFEVSNKCSPRESLKQGITHFLFIPLLTAVMVMLFVIVYLLADKYLSDSNDQEKGYMIALMVICGISGLVIFLLICNSVKETCIIGKLTNWVILSQNYDLDQSISPMKNEISKDDILERSASIENNVMLIPKKVTVRSKKVRTPTLNPPMVPVYRAGNAVAFTPRCISAMSLVSANSSLLMRRAASRSDPLSDNEQSGEKLDSNMPFLRNAEA
ncbi:unnamed protein product [Blepharisma stoltei]|uniref:RING-CH-type domain-containing protein n=1 Tax=Blepharisma stoltei TaxID=1481888 RepID=A0AAU9JZF8_9CILI|nr:unnamed protein product [Blepharisma stoltei]